MAGGTIATHGTSLYERDFFEWTQEQAAALRSVAAGGDSLLDYENLAEEIESLGNRDRREMSRRISAIIEHFLKLEFSPATEPRAGWRSAIRHERAEIELVLEDSPSLRRRVPEFISNEFVRTGRLIARELNEYGEDQASTAISVLGPEPRYCEQEVLGNEWFPEPKA